MSLFDNLYLKLLYCLPRSQKTPAAPCSTDPLGVYGVKVIANLFALLYKSPNLAGIPIAGQSNNDHLGLTRLAIPSPRSSK
jgi:hypothetical protein